MIKGRAETNTFFMGVLGWNKVAATANATAYMGVATNSAYDVNLLPVGFFTNTDRVDSLNVGQNYTLISFDVVSGTTSGNWGWINYTDEGGNASVLKAWLDCGFNPSITAQTWPDWCPQATNAHGEGPLQYWTGWPADGIAITGPYLGLTVRFGAGLDGWWLNGKTGAVSSACHELDDVAAGKHYIVPVFDTNNGDTGSGMLIHLYRLMKFQISSVDIRCNGQNEHFNIQGIYENTFAPGSSGWHGDIRHNSLHLIFMAP